MNVADCEGSIAPSLTSSERVFFANLTKTAESAGFGDKSAGTLEDEAIGAFVAGRG